MLGLRGPFFVLCAALFLAGFNFATVIVEFSTLHRPDRGWYALILLAINLGSALTITWVLRARLGLRA